MNNQAPQLDRGEMAAAENANIKAAEDIMRLLAKALRDHADQYPPKLRKSLSDPKAETNIEVSFNGKSVYSARLDKDQKHKEPPVNQIKESQAIFLKEALSKQKGESLRHPDINNMRVFVNGEKLFELKEGKVIQNDLPLEFSKTLSDMMQPKPLDLAINNFTQKMQEAYAQPLPQTQPEAQKSSAAQPKPIQQPQPTAQAEQKPQSEPAKTASAQQPQPASQPQSPGQSQQGAAAAASVQPNQSAAQSQQQPVSPPAAQPTPQAGAVKPQSVPQDQATAPAQTAAAQTKTIPGLDQSLNNGQWVPDSHQDSLNQKLIVQAKEMLNLMHPNQPEGHRQMDGQRFSIREAPDSISVRLKDINTTVEQKGDRVTGQARQSDIDGLRKANIAMSAIDNDKSSEMEMGD